MKLRALITIMTLAISLIPVAMITGIQSIQIATAFLFLILVVTCTVSWVTSYFITRPLTALTRTITHISKGNLDVQLEKSEITEINDLTQSLDRVMASLKLAIQKVGVKKEEIFTKNDPTHHAIEQKYNHLLKAMDGWVWEITPDGRCTTCTNNATAILGQPTDHLIGQPIDTLFTPDQTDQRQRIIHAFTTNQDTPFTIHHTLKHADGHPVSIQTTIIPLKDQTGKLTSLYCYSRDVPDMHTSLTEMDGLHDKLKTLIDAPVLPPTTTPATTPTEPSVPRTANFMVLLSDDMKIIDCSQGLTETLGLPRDHLVGHDADQIITFLGYSTVKVALQAAKTQGLFPVTLTSRTTDGTLITATGILEYLRDKNLFQYHPDL